MKKFTDRINESNEHFDPGQLEMGIKIESEHGDIYGELEKWMETTYQEHASMPWNRNEFYKKIAEAHLREMSDYYTRLTKMENE